MIGIMGGTFDPVHFGHLRAAVEVREFLALDELRLVPCREPPHRPMPVAPAEMRRLMLERAIRNEAGLLVDSRELERSEPSYTYETLRSMRAEFPTEKLALILGMDTFCGLPGWYRFQDLPKFAHFVVLHRPGYLTKIPEALSRYDRFRFLDRIEGLNEHQTGCVVFQKVSQLEISSTTIRDMVRQNQNPRYLLPDPVLKLIREQHLYR